MGKKNYITSFKLIELGDAYIELLEAFPCNSLDELTQREGQLIRDHKNSIHKCVAGRSKKEWTEDNKERVDAYHAQYIQENKDKIVARKAKY